MLPTRTSSKLLRACLVMAVATVPATAHAGEIYAGVSGGIALNEDSRNSGEFDAAVPATPDWGAIPAGTSLEWDTEFDSGFAISGVVGYAFDNGLRSEVELTYTRSGVKTHSGLAAGGAVIDGVDVAVLTRGAPSAANPTVGQVIADGQGDLTNMGVFANLFYDVPTGGPVSPYVGGGIGYVSTDVEYSPSGVGVADDKDGGLAWQAMAGLSVGLSESTDLFAQYTYRSRFDRAEVGLDLLPATLGVESNQSILSAGVRFRFGN